MSFAPPLSHPIIIATAAMTARIGPGKTTCFSAPVDIATTVRRRNLSLYMALVYIYSKRTENGEK